MTTRAHVTVRFPIYGVNETLELRADDTIGAVVLRAAATPAAWAAGVPQVTAEDDIATRVPAWTVFTSGARPLALDGEAERLLEDGGDYTAVEVISGG